MNVEPPDFGDEGYDEVNYKTCNRCGAGRLHWDDASGLLDVGWGEK